MLSRAGSTPAGSAATHLCCPLQGPGLGSAPTYLCSPLRAQVWGQRLPTCAFCCGSGPGVSAYPPVLSAAGPESGVRPSLPVLSVSGPPRPCHMCCLVEPLTSEGPASASPVHINALDPRSVPVPALPMAGPQSLQGQLLPQLPSWGPLGPLGSVLSWLSTLNLCRDSFCFQVRPPEALRVCPLPLLMRPTPSLHWAGPCPYPARCAPWLTLASVWDQTFGL